MMETKKNAGAAAAASAAANGDDNDDDDNNNNNNDNNNIEMHSSRLYILLTVPLTVSTAEAHALKAPSRANHVQHLGCYQM